MDVTERNRSRFSAPIPGFEARLRRAIGRRFPTVARCADALGVKSSTLKMWLGPEGGGGGRNSPKHLDDLIVLSAGLGVSIDWLVFGRTYSAREWVESTLGRRLKRAILEHHTLPEFRERIAVTPNMARRWFAGQQRPELFYLRTSAVILDLSLDWLARGEDWPHTEARHRLVPGEVAVILAARTLERMAERSVDPAVAHGLRCAARRAGHLPRVGVSEDQLPLLV